jgi:hypothetical protein
MSETVCSPSWDGSVVLDIGNDVGALVLHTSRQWLDHEIDLVPDDWSLPHTHSAVRERRSTDGSTYAAVYPQLQEGGYSIVGASQRFTIVGGRVTDIELAEPYSAPPHTHH